MIFTCVTFVFFTILVAVISYVKTKGDDQTTADGYFLAGRGLPGIVIAGSLLLTNLSAEQLVGTNGQTWAIGMSPMAFEVMAATALIVLALFARSCSVSAMTDPLSCGSPSHTSFCTCSCRFR